MTETIVALFSSNKRAGDAVSDFVEEGFAKDITVISKDEDSGKVEKHEVNDDGSEGATIGAGTGAIVGGLAGLLSGVSSFLIPGAGLIVLGPLASTLAGIGAGALTGGITGALIDWGLPDETAEQLETRIKAGEVLVGVTVSEDNEQVAREIMKRHQAEEVHVIED